MDQYVMDANALIAYLRGESGGDLVLERLEAAERGEEVIWMHALNLCEVYYDAYRSGGESVAGQLLEDVGELPLKFWRTMGRSLLLEAGRLKAAGGISLADAIAVGLANTKGAKLMTADHHELDLVEARGDGSFHWIR
jgi:predicted nucleic acid-binding protein